MTNCKLMKSINFFTSIPPEVWVEKLIYPKKCYQWFFLNKCTYSHRQCFISFLFRNIIEKCRFGVVQLRVEIRKEKIIINHQEWEIKNLSRFTKIVREAFISRGFSIPWNGRTITHHTQIMEAQNEAQISLKEFCLVWPRIRAALIRYNPSIRTTIFPSENTPVTILREFIDNPKNSIYLDNVKAFKFNELELTTFPFGINQFQNLEILDLSYNALTHVPDLAFPNLKKLYLNNNLLFAFTSDLQCPNLQILNISECQLKKFSPNLNNCKSLKIVNLNHNKLKKFSVKFKNCKEPEALLLKFNR